MSNGLPRRVCKVYNGALFVAVVVVAAVVVVRHSLLFLSVTLTFKSIDELEEDRFMKVSLSL